MTKKVITDESPALDFISSIPGQMEMNEVGEIKEAPAESPKPAATEEKAGETIDYIDDERKPAEAKSKHVQILIQPSTYDRVKEAAERHGVSMNGYINAAIKERLERE